MCAAVQHGFGVHHTCCGSPPDDPLLPPTLPPHWPLMQLDLWNNGHTPQPDDGVAELGQQLESSLGTRRLAQGGQQHRHWRCMWTPCSCAASA